MSIVDDAEREVRELHDFFEDWYAGTLADSEAAFARMADAMGDDFVMVSPDGDALDRDAVLSFVREGHGSHADGSFGVDVRNLRVRDVAGDRCLLVYEEWQDDGSEETGRVSTALFGSDPDAPRGVAWLHLQETWLSPPEE